MIEVGFDFKESFRATFNFLSDGLLFGFLVGGLYHFSIYIPVLNTIPLVFLTFAVSGFAYGAYCFLTSSHTIKYKVRFVLGGLAVGMLAMVAYITLNFVPYLPIDTFMFLPVFLASCIAYWVRTAYLLSVDFLVDQRQLDKTEKIKTKLQERKEKLMNELKTIDEREGAL